LGKRGYIMAQTSKMPAFAAGIFLQDDQTIIAQCTPRGSGALALLRLSGCTAITIATAMSKLAGNKKLIDLPTHTIHYGSIVDTNGGTIDQVLLFLMRAPHTFTGQDTVEISCHNNQFIVQAIITQAIARGARSAQEGEFTRRAVLNKKIDVIQAEAINELINANTQLALKKSLAQLQGSFSSWVTAIEQELYKALAFSESSFEFIDEEMQFGDQIKAIIETTLSTITTLKNSFNQQQQIRQGIRVALIGAVNAGKSSLFNALLQKERAIVTNIAGTTRDSIEAGVYKNGNYWTLIDTAGLRQTDDVIEKIGIARSFDEAAQADIIILVIDQARTMSEEELTVYTEIITAYEGKIIVVGNKCDLIENKEVWFDTFFASQKTLTTNGNENIWPKNFNSAGSTNTTNHSNLPLEEKNNIPFVVSAEAQGRGVSNHTSFKLLPISTTTLHNIDLLENSIEQKIATLFSSLDSPFLLNQRQFNLLLELEKKLSMVAPMLNDAIAYELVSYHLKDALENLAELTGKSISEQGMDTIFREFCIGK
jgi:tRNA modification GTPase